MTPLRLHMIEDMRTAGLASGTQSLYLDAVRNLAAHYRRSPDELSEEEVRAYLLSLRERGVALGTFKTNHGGIQFLYTSRWCANRPAVVFPLLGLRVSGSGRRPACRDLSSGSAHCIRLLPRSVDWIESGREVAGR